ncbi:hypothetical protein GLA29479_1765 [Lysobacter antibioticus]|nr:hypothetical protein GLA29479_1765 [Lysobacter antibioticus]
MGRISCRPSASGRAGVDRFGWSRLAPLLPLKQGRRGAQSPPETRRSTPMPGDRCRSGHLNRTIAAP